jgi:hypothetical protein
MNEKSRSGRVKRRLLIAALVLVVLVAVATVVVTGAIPMGTVTLCLDQESYRPDETVTLTIRSLRTGLVEFRVRSFEVQRFENGDWIDVPLDRVFRGRLAIVVTYPDGQRVDGIPFECEWPVRQGVTGPGRAYLQSFVPARDFLETPTPGRYRVVQEVHVGPIWDGAPREPRTIVAEFDIES